MEWKKVIVNKNNIAVDIGSAVLIKCPNKSDYHDWQFWYSKKLFKQRSAGIFELVYNDDFIIKLKRFNSKNELIKERSIDASELSEMFESAEDETYLIVKEPEKVDKKVEVLEEFKNDKKPTTSI